MDGRRPGPSLGPRPDTGRRPNSGRRRDNTLFEALMPTATGSATRAIALVMTIQALCGTASAIDIHVSPSPLAASAGPLVARSLDDARGMARGAAGAS